MSKRIFVLDINPQPWAIGPVGYARKGGSMSAYVGQNKQLHAFQEAVREEIGQQPMIEGQHMLRMYFWRNRAEYTTPNQRQHRKHEADVTNMVKSTEDALQGILFGNDRDTRRVMGEIVEQGPDVAGRIVIVIEPYIGTFAADVIEAITKHRNQPLPFDDDYVAWTPADDIF